MVGFVERYQDIFLAALAFWAMLPWALKMPLGHLVDLMWRMKALFVYLGASLIAASLLIMIGLLGHTVPASRRLVRPRSLAGADRIRRTRRRRRRHDSGSGAAQ